MVWENKTVAVNLLEIVFLATQECGDTLTIERGSTANGGGGREVSEEDMNKGQEALIHLEVQRKHKETANEYR